MTNPNYQWMLKCWREMMAKYKAGPTMTNPPDTPVSALPEDDEKLIARLRELARWYVAEIDKAISDDLNNAAARIETLSREIERVTGENVELRRMLGRHQSEASLAAHEKDHG